MRKTIVILVACLSFIIPINAIGQLSDDSSIVIFRFEFQNDMFDLNYSNNREQMQKLLLQIDQKKENILNNSEFIFVKGFTSYDNAHKEALQRASIRSNRVKSYLIEKCGVKESNFVTKNRLRDFKTEKDVVVVEIAFVESKTVADPKKETQSSDKGGKEEKTVQVSDNKKATKEPTAQPEIVEVKKESDKKENTILITAETIDPNIQEQPSIQDIRKEFQKENSYELSAIDESTMDEDAVLTGQNFSTLATFSNDPYLSEVGYQLSSFRFTPRGYKNIHAQTYLNGVEFNSQIRGNFNYSMIGGMNDATRNVTTQDFLQPSLFSFGDLAGTQNYDMRAGSYARGTKVTLTYTNRNYQQRAMISHHSGLNKNGWAFSALIGGRYAKEGIVEGTFYHNLAAFLGIEKQWANGRHSLSLSTFASPVQRAQQSASVQEAYDIQENNLYNSYWGYMPDGSKRNQRVVTAYDPTALLSHIWKIDRTSKLTTGVGIHYNRYGSTALNWFNNAKDPRPDYYRYLPSYDAKTYNTLDPAYITAANIWKGSGGEDRGRSQILWSEIYEANLNNNKYGANKSALYIIEERRNDALESSFNSTFEKKLTEEITLSAGVNARYTLGKTFDVVADLLGAEYLVDVDKFGERDFPGDTDKKQNNLNNPNRVVKEGDVFGYDYENHVTAGSLWAQIHHNYEHWEFFYAAKLAGNSFYRYGNMKNGRYPDNSFEKGKVHTFIDPAFKAGIVYKIDGRNLISVNGMYKKQAPLPYNAYTSPRVSDEVAPYLQSEKIRAADFNYVFTYPKINGRISAFYTDYHDGAQKISYYNDSYGTFVHHSISNVDKRNFGAEAGVKYTPIKNITLSLAGTWSQFTYTKNPLGTIRYENGTGEDFSEGVAIKDYFVGGSPQVAGTFGIQYFWNFWWFEVNVNGIAENYLDPSYIQRTPSVIAKVRSAADAAGYDTNQREALVKSWLQQTKLDDAYTVDISISKLIYLKGGKQLNINLNAMNILNNRNVRTGGYEQGRIPIYNNAIDLNNLNKFPAKFYYMQGLNVFLNVGYKF